jgi:hypothetical protein
VFLVRFPGRFRHVFAILSLNIWLDVERSVGPRTKAIMPQRIAVIVPPCPHLNGCLSLLFSHPHRDPPRLQPRFFWPGRFPQRWIVMFRINLFCFERLIDDTHLSLLAGRLEGRSSDRIDCKAAITPDVFRRINWTMVLGYLGIGAAWNKVRAIQPNVQPTLWC